MEYSKYALKSGDELKALLTDKDNLFIVSCNKCFKEMRGGAEEELSSVMSLASEMGKTVTGTASVDFLCNKTQTERKLTDLIPDGTKNMVVISCGLGVQTLADMESLPVFTATDSLNYIGHHGMALTKKTCDACAQCYLNLTGGLCPIADCTKSLLNGQCGGAKNGKCEIDPEKDCVWEKIYQKLKKQGRLEEFLSQPVQLRDYSKAGVKEIKDYVAAIRDGRFAGYYGGVHPCERKELSESISLKTFPEPEVVVIPTSMHAGAPANPIVSVGDYVKKGQKIAEAAAFISANIHSSVSGTVEAIEPRMHANRGMTMSIVIRSDGKDVIDESVVPAKPLEELTPQEIIDIVKEKGITGMGGAGFPTYVKLMPNKPIDAVLLNGCECEPILTADHRLMLEYADDIIDGLKAIMKAVDAPRGVIVIEDNKPDAIAHMQEKVAGLENIEVFPARTKYPQGGEKMLIKNVLGRQVPSGGLPADAGAVVCNVSTAKAISDAIRTGMPLVERVVSVTGERMQRPGNYICPIGTSVQEVIDYCGGTRGENVQIKLGGPMMGTPVSDTEVPVMKATNGIIAVPAEVKEPMDCIKCGRCADVCPMELTPFRFIVSVEDNDPQALLDLKIRDCMECRSCEYICSSRIDLVNKIREGKKLVMEMMKK